MVKSNRLMSFALVAMLLVGTATVLTPTVAGAVPVAPTLTAPGNGTTHTGNPSFTWAPISNVLYYTIQIAKDSGFTQVEYNSSTYQTTFTPWERLTLGQHYWRVFAVDGTGTSAPSGFSSFVIDKPNGPAFPTPTGSAANPKVFDYPNLPPTLAWDPVAGAVQYVVEMSTSDTFIAPQSFTMDGPGITLINNLAYEQNWFWRVSAKFNNGETSKFSPTNVFKVSWYDQDALHLVSPTHNNLNVRDNELVWEPMAGAAGYRVQINRASDFSGQFLLDEISYSSRVAKLTTLDNGSYYWRVQALDYGGNAGNWSDTRVFTRQWPTLPVLTGPGCDTTSGGCNLDALPLTGDSYSYSWAPIELASKYQIQVGPDINFSPNTYNECDVYEPHLTLHGVNIGQGSASQCFNVPYGQNYFWRVRGIDGPSGVIGLFSKTWAFKRGSVINLTGPANGATVTQPVLSWARPPHGVASFKVYVTDKDGNFVYNGVGTYATSFTPYDVLPPSGSPYKWWVAPVYTSGIHGVVSASNFRTFNLTAPVATGNLVFTTVPAPGPDMPSWTWSKYTGADQYKVYTRLKSGGPETYHGQVPGLGWTYPYDPTNAFPPGTYQVRVEAMASGVKQDDSGFQDFTIQGESDVSVADYTGAAACPTDAPAGCQFTSSPLLSWNPDPSATHYLVYVAFDAQFTSIFRQYVVPGTSLRPNEEYPDNNAAGAYYWHVRPCRGTICSLDPQGRTPPARAFRKTSVAFLQTEISPPNNVNNKIHIPTNPAVASPAGRTFTWPNYLSKNTRVEAAYYQVQVSTTINFSNVIDNTTMDQNFYTPSNKQYPFDVPLYWRVRTIDGNGNTLAWSTANAFQRLGVAPTNLTPANLQQFDGLPTLKWDNLVGAARYRVEFYKNADTDPGVSPSNFMFSIDTPNRILTPYSALPPGWYQWRVAGWDGAGNLGPWNTGAHKFRVKDSAPGPDHPNDTQFTNDNIVFQWSPPTNVASGVQIAYYRVEVSQSPDFTSLIEQRNTVMLSWATLNQYAPSNNPYYWRVTAINSSGVPLSAPASGLDNQGNPNPGVLRFYQYRGRSTQPNSVTVTNMPGTVRVNWAPPTFQGAGPIVSYTAVITPGATPVAPPPVVTPASSSQTVNASTYSITFTGLTNGKSYGVALYATNSTNAPSQLVLRTGVPNGCAQTPFNDVAAVGPFCNEIAWLFGTRITTGNPQPDGGTSYKPNDNVSRIAMAAFLYRLMGSPAVSQTQRFADVPQGSVRPEFYNAVNWMFNEGISTGTKNPPNCTPNVNCGMPLYLPNEAVSRQAMAAFMHRTAGNVAPAPHAQRFLDVNNTNIFYNDIQWMGETGISTGTNNPPGCDPNTNCGLPLYKPGDPVTRQAMAAFIYRYNTKFNVIP